MFLAAQIAVPAIALFEPRPARFAWQMYSGDDRRATYELVRSDGTVSELHLADYMANPRLDMDLAAVLPALVCDVEPDGMTVRIQHAFIDTSEDVPCKR